MTSHPENTDAAPARSDITPNAPEQLDEPTRPDWERFGLVDADENIAARDAVADRLSPIVDRLLLVADPRVLTASRALIGLYAAHQREGGIWPDTYDEQRAVAVALGVPVPERDEAVLTVLWDVAQNGADEFEWGAAHVAALIGGAS